MTCALFDRYLRILGIARREPSHEALAELVAAHLTRVPFENVSKLYARKQGNHRGLPELASFLDGIERYNFGGTCYSNNYFLYLLLQDLGYEVMLCGADMENPDVHIVSIVRLDGLEYIVDGGYGAPFLEPMPRGLTEDYAVTLGRDRYLLKSQDSEGRSRLEMHRDGEYMHGYVAKPIPRTIDHFADVIAHSYTDEATFMNALLLIRFFPNRAIAINNLKLIFTEGTEVDIRPLGNVDALPPVIEENFSIPQAIVAEALTMLRKLGDAWS
jgi:arylamine N-acetyltransferase